MISAANATADVIKYRSSISTHFADFNKMELETQTELDELVAITNDYLLQVNRWLVHYSLRHLSRWPYSNDRHQQIA
jgi:hypothetical protein